MRSGVGSRVGLGCLEKGVQIQNDHPSQTCTPNQSQYSTARLRPKGPSSLDLADIEKIRQLEALWELENLSYRVMAFADRAIENNRNPWCRSANRNVSRGANYHGVLAHYNIECQVGTDSEFQSSRPHAVVGEEKLPHVFGVGKKELLYSFPSPLQCFSRALTAIALALSDAAYHATRPTIHMIN